MMNLVFVGSGVSCAIPVIGHLGNGPRCACEDAMRHPEGPNRRNNVSLLIQIPSEELEMQSEKQRGGDCPEENERTPQAAGERRCRNVLIDCGKTFYDAYFRVLAPRRVTHVDVLLLTHGHADAMQCVGDLCALHTEVRARLRHGGRSGGAEAGAGGGGDLPPSLRFIPTYLTEPTLRELNDVAPDVVQASRRLGSAPTTVTQCGEVAGAPLAAHRGAGMEAAAPPTALDLFILPEDAPTRMHMAPLHGSGRVGQDDDAHVGTSSSVPFYSLPVEHGKDYISLGFVFGSGVRFLSEEERRTATEAERKARRDALEGKSCVVYISDVSTIIPTSMAFLESLVKIDVLIFDLLAEKGRKSAPHTCWDDCMPVLRRLTPTRTYFVGMFCSLEHAASNALWQVDLAAEKATVHTDLCSMSHERGTGDCGGLESEGVDRMRRFVTDVKSAELAYDGLELRLPL